MPPPDGWLDGWLVYASAIETARAPGERGGGEGERGSGDDGRGTEPAAVSSEGQEHLFAIIVHTISIWPTL